MVQKQKQLGPKCLVKIGSVKAEILRIWTNVARFTGQMSPCWLASVKDGPRSLPLEFGLNWRVTAEIFEIWTNVAWTNVTWKNVTVTVAICSRCSQEPTIKSFIKIGSVTAEILLILSFCAGWVVGGRWWWWLRVILVLSQA